MKLVSFNLLTSISFAGCLSW